MGKRKIPLAKIENDQYRIVSFSKRRKGLFKKTEELSALTGALTAVLVVSEAGRPYASAAVASGDSDAVQKFLFATSDGEKSPISNDGEGCSVASSLSDDEITGVSLIGELLGIDIGNCVGFEELLKLRQNLKEMKERVRLAVDFQFMNSLLDS